MRFQSILKITCWLALVAFLASPASAQLTRLHVGYSAISADQLPAWVA